jgi:hypothetical protein
VAGHQRQTGVGELALPNLRITVRLSRKTKNATDDPANLTPCVPSIFYPIRERLMHCGRGLRGNKNLDIRFTYGR